MALFPCHECGAQISSEAKSCPSCGAKPRPPQIPLLKQPRGYLKIAFALFFGWVVFQFAGGGRPEQPPEKPVACFEEQCRGAESGLAIIRAKDSLRAHLKDPDSARFNGLRYFPPAESSLAAVCGSFNARNSFGGFSDVDRFISLGTPSLTYIEAQATEFQERWAKYCPGM